MLIKVKVHVGSKAPAVTKRSEDSFEIWVRSEAKEGLANREVLTLLAREIGCAPKQLYMVKGASSPHKIIKILGS